MTPPATHPIGRLTLPPMHLQTLPNGIELYTLNSGDLDVNQLFLTWQGGDMEGPNRLVPSLCSHMLTEGAGGMTEAEISEKLDFRGAVLRTDANPHHSVLSLICVNSLASGMAPVLRAIVEAPDFPAEQLVKLVDRERKRFMQERAKVATLARIAMAPLIMGEYHPMAQDVTMQDFDNATTQQMVDFHRRVYTGHGCKAFLSGKLTESVLGDVRDFLMTMPCREPACSVDVQPFTPMDPQRVFVEKADALQSAVRISLPAIPRSHPDYLPLRFTVIALGGYFGSRLMLNIREEKGYTYGINAALVGQMEGSYVSITAQCANEYVEAVISETFHEMERLATELMPDDELHRLKLHVQTSLVETVDSPFSIMDYYRTRLLVGLPDNYFEEQVRLSRDIDAETIRQMAAKYLQPSLAYVAVAGAACQQA